MPREFVVDNFKDIYNEEFFCDLVINGQGTSGSLVTSNNLSNLGVSSSLGYLTSDLYYDNSPAGFPAGATTAIRFGANSYLELDINKYGSSDYTVESWFYFQTYGAFLSAFGTYLWSGRSSTSNPPNGSGLLVYNGGPSGAGSLTPDGVNDSPAGSLPLNTWTHIVYVKKDGYGTYYANGQKILGPIIDNINWTSGKLGILGYPDTDPSNGSKINHGTGLFAGFRVIKKPLYTSNFTVPNINNSNKVLIPTTKINFLYQTTKGAISLKGNNTPYTLRTDKPRI